MQVPERAVCVQQVLAALYPDPRPHLMAKDAWELMVATQLAAQCTDARVNQVTPGLFKRWPDARAMADAALPDLEEAIRSTGFYRNKAKNLKAAAQKIVNEFAGRMPATLAELITLPGVARKTANVVLTGAFGKNEGLAVDTHVGRIARRLGLSGCQDPNKVEQDLLPLFPQVEWGNVNHRMVSFGRAVCKARKPDCPDCPMAKFCPRIGV